LIQSKNQRIFVWGACLLKKVMIYIFNPDLKKRFNISNVPLCWNKHFPPTHDKHVLPAHPLVLACTHNCPWPVAALALRAHAHPCLADARTDTCGHSVHRSQHARVPAVTAHTCKRSREVPSAHTRAVAARARAATAHTCMCSHGTRAFAAHTCAVTAHTRNHSTNMQSEHTYAVTARTQSEHTHTITAHTHNHSTHTQSQHTRPVAARARSHSTHVSSQHTCHRSTHVQSQHTRVIAAHTCHRSTHVSSQHTGAVAAHTCHRSTHVSSQHIRAVAAHTCHRSTHVQSQHIRVIAAHTCSCSTHARVALLPLPSPRHTAPPRCTLSCAPVPTGEHPAQAPTSLPPPLAHAVTRHTGIFLLQLSGT